MAHAVGGSVVFMCTDVTSNAFELSDSTFISMVSGFKCAVQKGSSYKNKRFAKDICVDTTAI